MIKKLIVILVLAVAAVGARAELADAGVRYGDGAMAGIDLHFHVGGAISTNAWFYAQYSGYPVPRISLNTSVYNHQTGRWAGTGWWETAPGFHIAGPYVPAASGWFYVVHHYYRHVPGASVVNETVGWVRLGAVGASSAKKVKKPKRRPASPPIGRTSHP